MARAALVLLTLLLSGVPVAAEHEVYYRYVVLGYVMDARGKPLGDAPVALVRDKTGFSYAGASDARGFYVLVARLGDESAGETLTLRVRALSTPLAARFDPSNHTDERGTRVDLEGTRFVEHAEQFRATLAGFLGGGAR